jgi:transposase
MSDWRMNSPATVGRTRGPTRASPPPPQRRLSSRQASFLFLKQPEARSPTHQSSLEQRCQASEERKQADAWSQQFVVMVRQRQGTQRDAWLQRTRARGSHERIGCASGIRRDSAAVQAGVSRMERNGQVEGQMNRLKYLKRPMYGRAPFDLLRLRVLHAAYTHPSRNMLQSRHSEPMESRNGRFFEGERHDHFFRFNGASFS